MNTSKSFFKSLIKVLFLLIYSGPSLMAWNANDCNPASETENLYLAYQLADCENEELFYNAYLALKNKEGLDKPIVSFENSLVMLPACDECPELTFASLQGVAGFPQVDDISLCGAADTVSVLVYNAGDCPMSNLVLTVNFDSGLAYGGFVEENSGKPVAEFNVSDASNPQFLITTMDSAEVYILNFGLTADCDVDFSSPDPLNFDISFDFSYENSASGNATCSGVETEIGNFNNGIKVPVLNVLSVAPVTRNITASNTNGCQVITIRQDGLGAKLGDFNLDICGYNDAYILTEFRSTSPNTDIPYTIDPVTGNVTGFIDGTHIMNIGNGDAVMDANESMTVQVCYQVEGCLDDAMFLEYKATYGCNGKKCGDPSSIEGAVAYVPDFAATALASSSMVEYGAICGENLKFDLSLTSANSDPLDGLWEDLSIKFNACLGSNMSLVDVTMNGTSLPSSVVIQTGSSVELDFSQLTTDPDGAGVGLEALDGDGIFDDLAGGQPLAFMVEVAIGCAAPSSACQALACSISNIEVSGKRNCGQDFQQFAALDTPINFFYGETGNSTNAMADPDYFIPISEVFVTEPNVWLPTANGLEFSYDFGFENIEPCANPGMTKLVIRIAASGNRIDNIRHEAGTATYQGASVPETGDWIVDSGTGDTIAYEIEILAGDPAAATHDYFVNLEIRGDCFPDDYAYVSYKVIEECLDCGGTDPCEIVRSCAESALFVEWNGLDCPCFVEAWVDTLYRVNYGYADKEMTQKLTIDDVPIADRQRFLPGDTMFLRGSYQFNSIDALKGAYKQWIFRLMPNHNGLGAAPLIPDPNNTDLIGWFWEDVSSGATVEIGIPDCLLDYPDATRPDYDFPSLKLTNMGLDSEPKTTANNGGDPLAAYGACLDDPNINPNYPPESAVNYDNAYTGTLMNGGEIRLSLLFDEGDLAGDCGSQNNTCFDEFFEQFNLEDGDIIHFDVQTVMMHSPYADLDALNGTGLSSAQTFVPSFVGYETRPSNCGLNTVLSSCNFSRPFQGHVPGPVSVTNDIVVTDCDTEVTYDFNLTNAVPTDLAVGELPWYENEYRPFMATEYLQLQFPNNMVYGGDGVIIMPDGTEVPIPAANIDEDYGNLVCIDDGAGGLCCVAQDGTQLAALQINDDDFYVGRSLPYSDGVDGPNETSNYCDVNQLYHQKNDPFPHLMVGGAEECGYGIRYNLSSLCPEEISSGDFALKYQFAEPYIPSMPGNNVGSGVSGSFYASGIQYPNRANNLFPINPYGEDCATANGLGCRSFFELIDPDPILSPEAVNPLRQTGCLTTSPDNFTDNSLDYPPLTAMLQNLLIADLGGASEFNTYEVCAGDVAGSATHMNVVTTITVDNSVDFLGVTDAGGSPLTWSLVGSDATSKTYSLTMPDLAPGVCESIIIETELLFCPIGLDITTDVCVSTVSGCLDPAKASAIASLSEGCNSAGECYKYIAEEADLQAEWQPDALPEIPLCDIVNLQTVVKNVKQANLIDIDANWSFPAGLNFVPGSWEICYPCGPNNAGPCFPIVDPTPDAAQNSVNGTYFEYQDDQIWSSALPGDPINSNGLPGILSSLDSNFVKFKFDVETICDEFISGTSISFGVDAADPCEQRVGPGNVPSPPIIVEGANPADFAQFLVFADPVEASCGTTSEIVLTYLNTSPFGVTDNSMVCMDIETSTFAYMPGSVYMVSPATYTPTFTESTNGSITHICFDIPDGIGPGQVFQTGFSFMVPENLACGTQDLGVQVSSELMNASCMAQGIECSVGVLNSVNPVIMIDFLPPVTVEKQDLRMGCSTTDGKVEMCYDVELVNNGATYSNDINIALIYDVDQNGQIDDYDTKLDSVMTPVLIPAGDTLMLSGCLEVPADQACPVFLIVMQETNCVCDAQDYYYPSLQPDLGLDGQTSFGVCPGEPFGMELCGDFTYTLEPSTGGTITETADSLFVELDDAASEVTLNVTGNVGQCEPFDYDVTIKSLMDFELGPFSTVQVCSNDCTVLNAGIPIEFQPDITVEWIPATYLDDPTSMTPTACNVTDDITYTVIATFTSGDAICVFNADVPLIVTDPVTEDIFEDGFLCETDVTPLEAPAGKDNYFWYEVNPAGDDVVAHVGASFSPEAPGDYYLECWSNDDVCHSNSNVFTIKPCVDLALTKTVNPSTPGPYSNGSTITYDITVYNQSTTVDVFNVYVKDYFPECLVLTDPNWILTTAATTTTNGEATIVSPIAFIPANGQQTRTVTFTISPICMSTPIINNSEISEYDDDNDPMTPTAPDEDSTPNDDSGTPAETGTDDNYDDDNPNMPGTMDDPADSDDYDPAEIELTPCPTLAGEVFIDLNNNGCQDANDTDMVEGVDVTIWSCDPVTGAPVSSVGTVTTGSDGQWSFGGPNPDGTCILDPDAQYTASFDIPNQPGDLPGDPYVGYEFSTGTAPAGCAAGEDDNVDPATGQAESCFDPDDDDAGDGDDDENIDAGISPPCETIGGEVFVDVNDNGCQDAGETMMVEGAVATIWECDPLTGDPLTNMGTDTTGADGSWMFGGVDPITGECVLDHTQTYTVVFEIPNQAGDDFEGYAFSEGTDACATGDADDVDPATGQAEDCYDPGDGDGGDDEDIDAGITPPCQSIGGEVFVDENNNGCQDATETTMVEGAEATIWECDPITGDPVMAVGIATTGADGTWSFGGPDPVTGECLLDAESTYTVTFDIPNAAGDVAGDPYVGYELSTGEADATCTTGEADDVDPDTGQAESCYDPNDNGDGDEDIDAGISPCETMGGEVFVDDNNNGCQDAGEMTMVEGVGVTIWTCDPITGEPTTPVGTATTGPDGAWSFGGADPATGDCLLEAGQQYTVSFDIPNAAGDVAGDPYVGYELSISVADATCVDGEEDDVDPGTGIAEDCYDPDDEDGDDGDDDEDIDAGISPCETMGGEVYVDENNNGCQDAGETMMVEGVEVNIWVCDPVTGNPSAVIGTATTGADGQWSFGGADPATGECLLEAGQKYTVSFDIPNAAGDVAGDPYVGYELSTGVADATCADGEEDDVDPGTGIAEDCFDPDDEDGDDGDDDEDIDAGISPCETMGGEVYVDDNNNGCQDAGEMTMVEGVEVTIWTCDPTTGEPSAVVGTSTTGADGQWSFGGADPATGECLLEAGQQYTVSFDIPNAAGDVAGDPYVGYELSTGVADASCTDGEEDDVDPGTGIAEDCYDPDDEDGDDGDDDEDIDAGISPCETMGGEVFVDENNNGCQDAGETMMVEGVEVNIWVCDPVTGNPSVVIGTATTGADGQWSFGGADPATGECLLEAGQQYTVSFDIPNTTGDVAGDPYVGFELSTGVADGTCVDGEEDDVDPGTGIAEDCFDPDDEDGGDGDDDEDIDAGISPCETMGGEVYIDENNNGCQDATEMTMVEGVEVTIWTCDPLTGDPTSVVGTSTTGADGSWSFGGADPATGECLLAAGQEYTVSFDLPNAAGDIAGDPYVGYDFSTESADDSCVDGEADDVDEDTGIAEDCFDPDDEDGGDGDDDEDIDAGISPCESIGGEVFVDTNNNGCQEVDETTPVPGVEVTIFACDPITGEPTTPVGTATTGADGSWSLSGADPATGDCLLDPDMTYSASFDLPDGPGEAFEGYVFSMVDTEVCPDPADADDVDPATGESDCYDPSDDDGDGDEDIDAGIYPCQELGGTVFYDDNINGCQDNGETAVTEMVGVSLFECGQDPDFDTPISSTTTINGEYEFGLDSPNEDAQVCLDANKTYFVVFDIPAAPGEDLEGYVFTDGEETCAAPEDADDVDPATGESECYGPGDDDGDDDQDIDAGIFQCQNLEGTVFYDNDNNGCQEGNESVVTIEVSVTLYECGQTPGVDTPVASTMTMDGEYEFGPESMNVDADVCLKATTTYFVVFDLPNDSPADPLYGFEFSTNQGTCAGPELEDDVDPTNGQSECYNPDGNDGDDGDDHVDSGIYPCQELGGEVFFDVSNDGCQDTGENLITEAIDVELYECGQTPGVDTPVGTTTTVDGEYEFGQDADDPNAQVCLESGTLYFVHFDIPNGAGEALQGFGLSTNDDFCVGEGTADDVDPTTGNSECYDPADDDDGDGEDDDHIDAGLYECEDLGGTVFYDMNNNGCQDAGETAVTEEIGVTLYECDAGAPGGGTPVASTTTIDGEYEFGAFSPNEGAMVCLEPGKEYYVEFDIPNGAGEALENWNLSSHADECANSSDSDDVDPATGQSGCYDPEDAGDDGDNDGDNGDGNDDNHIDAGIYPCEEVSGEIFFDYNGDGCQGAGDDLVTDPVNVSIYECGAEPGVDAPVATTTTTDGMYEFGVDSDDPGADVCLDPYFDYTIVFDFDMGAGSPLEAMDFTEGEEACADSGDADDVDPETGQSECYDAGDDDGDGDEDIDAGIDPCEELAGEIFYDNNNNGCQDAGEELVMEAINVSVYECGQMPGTDDPVASTTTTDGEFDFGVESEYPGADVCLDPAKDYFVVFDLPNDDGEALDNFVFSDGGGGAACANPGDASDVDPNTGQTTCQDPGDEAGDHHDGGIYECQDLSGEIFLDVNNNGCQDNGEMLVTEEVMVEIFECDASGNPAGPAVGSITTTDGMYEFGPDSEDAGGNVCLDPAKTYSVQFSFDDSDGAPLQGHNFSGDGGACADATDSDDIDPSTGQSGCFNPNDDDGDDGNDDNHVDAGINPCQEISGEVFFDIAGDGCEDGDDTNVTEPVTVTLYECNNGTASGGTPIAQTTTIDGQYVFGEESPNPGGQVCLQSDKQYYVAFDLPNSPGQALDNYVFTNGSGSNCNGTADSDDVDDLTGRSECYGPDDSDGDDDDHIDAGIMELASIGNYVWHDADGDGIQDINEDPIRNVVVKLFDGDGNLVSITTTDSNGFYLFDRLYPGDYYLEFGPPSQYPLTTDPGQGNDSELDSDIDGSNGPNTTQITTLTPGEFDPSWDAGFYKCIPVGELVWYDVDMDNVWDDNENGINGLEVTLYRNVNGNWTRYARQSTGHKPGTPSDDGYYKFCAPPGEYYLHIDLPPYGLVSVRSDIGNDELRDSDFDHGNGPGTTSTFTLISGDERCDIGAGFYPMATVGDIVWMDDNADGVRQPSEAFAQGVLVEAYDIYNDLVGSDITDANGNYMIDYLQQEGYYIRIQPPSGYTVTNANVGSDESMDSDINHSNGNYTTEYYMMAPGVHMPNVDAGLVAGVALPVELLSFTGQYRPDFIALNWVTAAEINTEYFQIERRHESETDFVSIGRQIAKGSDSRYEVNDYDVQWSGTYYYRLRSIDNDGAEQLSEVISVDIRRDEKDGVSIYPNPAVADVNIEISLSDAKQVSIDLYDTQGKLIRGKLFNGRLDAGKINKVIKVDNIPAGVYNVQIQLGSEVLTRRLILLKN